MGKQKQKSNTQSFPSWTNKALQSYLTQRKVIWHSWMKKIGAGKVMPGK
jgi:hypothetical protein